MQEIKSFKFDVHNHVKGQNCNFFKSWIEYTNSWVLVNKSVSAWLIVSCPMSRRVMRWKAKTSERAGKRTPTSDISSGGTSDQKPAVWTHRMGSTKTLNRNIQSQPTIQAMSRNFMQFLHAFFLFLFFFFYLIRPSEQWKQACFCSIILPDFTYFTPRKGVWRSENNGRGRSKNLLTENLINLFWGEDLMNINRIYWPSLTY